MGRIKYQSGSLSYRRRTNGAVLGREDWSLTRQLDGSRTLRSVTLLNEALLTREVSYTLGPDLRPASVYLRMQVADQLIATSYFHNKGTTLELLCDATDSGHTEQTTPVPKRFHIFTHATIADGWLSWCCEPVPRKEQAVTIYHAAATWDGLEGPPGRLKTLRGVYLGEGELEVPAGIFKARRLRFEALNFPPLEIWVTGKDNILIKAEWREADLEAVLVSLRADPHFNSGAQA